MKKKNKKIKSYEDDIITFEDKEEEIIESYVDDYDEDDEDEVIYEEFEEEKEETPQIISSTNIDDEYEDYEDSYSERKKNYYGMKTIRTIINVIFIAIMVAIIMIATDVICVARYSKGPFFAIPLKTYKDGGSKAYYGLGYKVIKYDQLQGRRDKELGFWSLKYNSNPITVKDVDLAIEFYEDETTSYEKYYKQFVRITSKLQEVDTKKHTIKIGYVDDEGKYTLEINCDVVKDQKNLKDLKVGEEITIIGSVDKYKAATKKQPRKLYIKNCFAEQ